MDKLKNTKTLFIHAYRGFSMRYILCTDIIKILQNNVDHIVMFVRDDDLPYLSTLYKNQNITLESVEFEEARRETTKNIFVRSLILLRRFTSGRKNGMINYTDNLNKIQFKEEFSFGWGRRIYLCICIWSLLTSRFSSLRKLMRLKNRLLLSGKMYDKYFRKYRPSALLIASIGYGIDDLMMNSARRNNCPVISLPFSWDNSSTRGYRGGTPDCVITWTDRMAKEVEVFHDLPRSSIIVGGVAHWDSYFNGSYQPRSKSEFFRDKSLDESKKLLLYTLSAPRHLRHRFDIIEMILESIAESEIDIACQLLVRFHPSDLFINPDGTIRINDYGNNIERIQKKYGPLVSFWTPTVPHKDNHGALSMDDMFEMAEAITHSDIVVQEYSTLIMETTIFNKPVINISMYEWDQNLPISTSFATRTHLRHILSFDSCTTIENKREFICAVNTYLKDPKIKEEQRMKLLDSELNTNRGTAGIAIGNIIIEKIDSLSRS